MLYVCLKDETSSAPSFFYYKKSDPKGQQIKQIKYITGRKDIKHSDIAIAQFAEGDSLIFFRPPYFFISQQNTQIEPEKHCSVTTDSQGSKLVCKLPDSRVPEYSKKIQPIL